MRQVQLRKGSDYNENRAYATQPKYPLTSTSHE